MWSAHPEKTRCLIVGHPVAEINIHSGAGTTNEALRSGRHAKAGSSRGSIPKTRAFPTKLLAEKLIAES
jgi:hypothetical protein